MSGDSPQQQKLTYLGKVDFRNKQLPFGIKEKDRTKHMYVIGKSGMGKSTLLENLAVQDVNNGEGLCVIDPHGSFAERLLDYIPESRVKDVVYFAPFDGEYPIGLNMLEKVPADKRYLVANGLMSAFKKIFTDGDGKGTFSARMEYVLNNIILALLENENQTLLGVNRMLFDKDFRKFIVSNVTDPTVRDFWVNEYANYTEKTAQDLAPAIQNKIGQFVSNPLIRNIIGQQKTSFDVRKLMDEKKIFIVNLSKGKVGEGNANLLGSLLITKIYLAAMSRADVGPYESEKLPPFYFYVDEFQNFANESFANILSEARKYKLALTVAHQYVEQMTDEVRSAVFGNVGTMITFRIGATDAEVFEKEFAPYFIMDDFVNLSAYQIYLRLMIDGQGSRPFSAATLARIEQPTQSFVQAVIAHSRATYAKKKFEAEEEIAEFYKPVPKEEKKRGAIFVKPAVSSQAPAYVPEERKVVSVKSVYEGNREPRRDPRQEMRNPQSTYKPKQQEQKSLPVVEKYSAQERKQEPVRESITPLAKEFVQPARPQTFDDRPAMSLKDALSKALQENTQPIVSDSKHAPKVVDSIKPAYQKIVVDTPKHEVTNTQAPITEEEKQKRKEVEETVLRKLIEE
jgi:energy-coupling factor transporter ATP-binding protein EcfA2